MKERNHKHLFPIIDAMTSKAAMEAAESEDSPITCEVGCTHCCHLLIEVSWEEAEELVDWLEDQPTEVRAPIEGRISTNAAKAREFFRGFAGGELFAEPVSGDHELSEEIYDRYFYDESRPCPFLEQSGRCSAYEARPTSCRLHMVSSDPQFCSREIDDEDQFDIPDAIEELKEHAAPVIDSVEQDGRWGHFAILVESALEERRNNTKIPSVG